MGEVVRFTRRGHARASRLARRSISGVSEVSRPSASSSHQCRDGIEPRLRQELTVEGDRPRARETSPVPPKASIISLTVSDICANIVRKSRTCQVFANRETTANLINVQMRAMREPDDIDEIADRLIATREALDLSQAEFAEQIGTSKTVYNPFEKGKRRISLDVALGMYRRYAIPLDWTYCGDPDKLPTHIYKKLRVRGAA